MARPRAENLTPLELEIMQILWERGASSVQTVQEQLGRESAYTSVQTMLNVLHRKGKVKRTLKDRAYFYRPAVSRAQITKQAIGDMVDKLFGGSAESLVMSLVETKHLTPGKLAELTQLIDERQSEVQKERARKEEGK